MSIIITFLVLFRFDNTEEAKLWRIVRRYDATNIDSSVQNAITKQPWT